LLPHVVCAAAVPHSAVAEHAPSVLHDFSLIYFLAFYSECHTNPSISPPIGALTVSLITTSMHDHNVEGAAAATC
jgi:hypothetical protein